MPKVKKEDTTVKVDEPIDPDAPVMQIDEEVIPRKPKEKLITVTAFTWFSDGNLCESMEQYGYPCAWPAGETRSLPMWLLKRCESSGAEFVEPNP